MTEDIKNWMDDVKLNLPLVGGKGVITAIQQPAVAKTKFGDRKYIVFLIEDAEHSQINTAVFLPPNFPAVHPKSTFAKIMRKYGCKRVNELIGKEVEVEEVGDMIWKIKVD